MNVMAKISDEVLVEETAVDPRTALREAIAHHEEVERGLKAHREAIKNATSLNRPRLPSKRCAARLKALQTDASAPLPSE